MVAVLGEGTVRKGHNRKEGVYWSVTLLPDTPHAPILRFRINKKKVLWGVSGVVLLIIAALIGLTYSIAFYHDLHKLRAQAKEYEELKQEFVKVQKYAYELQSELNVLQKNVDKLKFMAGTLVGATETKKVGLGGKEYARTNDFPRELLYEQQWSLIEQRNNARQLRYEIQTIERIFEQKTVALSSTPSILPVNGYIISGFGHRLDPFKGVPEFHQGLDISAPRGTPVVSAANGVVLLAKRQPGYGKLIIIEHGLGVTTYYAHLSKILVKRGEKVKRWQIIGLVGSTGRSTAPHLHYEIRFKDHPINPMQFILGSM